MMKVSKSAQRPLKALRLSAAWAVVIRVARMCPISTIAQQTARITATITTALWIAQMQVTIIRNPIMMKVSKSAQHLLKALHLSAAWAVVIRVAQMRPITTIAQQTARIIATIITALWIAQMQITIILNRSTMGMGTTKFEHFSFQPHGQRLSQFSLAKSSIMSKIRVETMGKIGISIHMLSHTFEDTLILMDGKRVLIEDILTIQ